MPKIFVGYCDTLFGAGYKQVPPEQIGTMSVVAVLYRSVGISVVCDCAQTADHLRVISGVEPDDSSSSGKPLVWIPSDGLSAVTKEGFEELLRNAGYDVQHFD